MEFFVQRPSTPPSFRDQVEWGMMQQANTLNKDAFFAFVDMTHPS